MLSQASLALSMRPPSQASPAAPSPGPNAKEPENVEEEATALVERFDIEAYSDFSAK